MASFSRLRGRAPLAGTALRIAAGAGALYASYELVSRRQHIRADAVDASDAVLKAPSPKWIPPTRKEMLEALKGNKSLASRYEPTEQLDQARNTDSAGRTQDLGQDGYDLLVRTYCYVYLAEKVN